MMEALRLSGFAALTEEEEETGRRQNGEVGRKRVASCRLETQEAMKPSLQFCVLWFIARPPLPFSPTGRSALCV